MELDFSGYIVYAAIMDLIERKTDRAISDKFMSIFPVTAILGPRQCGKTTLARTLAVDHYFDLENPRDIARLEQPQLTLEDMKGIIVIDEIQRLPDLFPLLRHLVDQKKNAKKRLQSKLQPDDFLVGARGFEPPTP